MAAATVPRPKPNYADRSTRKTRGDSRAPGKAQQAEQEAEQSAYDGMTPEQRAREQRYNVLTATVDEAIREAISARETSGIEEIWAEDDDQYNGIDRLSIGTPGNVKTRDQQARSGEKGVRASVFVPITKPKTDTAVARVTEMLLPNDGDPPFAIEPTPMPEIEAMAKGEMDGGDDTVMLGDGSVAPAQVVAEMHMAQCTKFAEAEFTWIQDKFAEGMVYSEMRQVLRDAARIGTGALMGPIPVQRIRQRWHRQPKKPPTAVAGTNVVPLPGVNTDAQVPTVSTQDATSPQSYPQDRGYPQGPSDVPLTPVMQGVTTMLVRIESIEPTSVCVRAQDCYPDPSCGDSIHNGAYFVYRDYLTGRKLRDMARLPGYDPYCIVQALKEGPQPYVKRRMNNERVKQGDTTYDAKLYEVFHYYADMTPEDMRTLNLRTNPHPDSMQKETETGGEPPDEQGIDEQPDPLKGILSDEDLLYLQSVPVVVTMLNNRPIKCDINPLATGKFPFDLFPWEQIKGQPWGRGIPRQMGVAQRMLNAAVRRMLENAGLAAGPQIVIAKGVITPWDGKNEITSPKGWDANLEEAGLDDVRKAFAVFNIDSRQEELANIITMALDFADRLTNMPMLMQGDQNPGDAPETLGGRKLFFDNAMSPLRVLAKGWDDRLMVPHIQRYHDWGQDQGPESIKGGDMNIVGLGSTAMIQREEGREFLMQIFAVKDDPALRIDPVKLTMAMGRSNSFDFTSIQYSEDDWKKHQEELAQNPPVDPAVQAMQLRKEIAELQLKSAEQQGQLDRNAAQRLADQRNAHEQFMKAVDERIANTTAGSREHVALMSLKGHLAASAMQDRRKADEMNLKLSPANPSHLGI